MTYYVIRVKDKNGRFKVVNSIDGTLVDARSMAADITSLTGMTTYIVKKAVKEIMKGIYVNSSIIRSLGRDEPLGTVEFFRNDLVWFSPTGEYYKLNRNGKLGKKVL